MINEYVLGMSMDGEGCIAKDALLWIIDYGIF